jgi:hypothetical protein
VEIEVTTSDVTAPHVRSPEWLAGYEVGRRDGVETGKAEVKKRQDAGKAKQNEAVLDVVRSALRMFEQDDDVAEDIIKWTRSRLGSS